MGHSSHTSREVTGSAATCQHRPATAAQPAPHTPAGHRCSSPWPLDWGSTSGSLLGTQPPPKPGPTGHLLAGKLSPVSPHRGSSYSYIHRTVWVGKHLKYHPVPNLCHEQGHLPLAQAAPGPIQSGLELLQGEAPPCPISCLPRAKLRELHLTTSQNMASN